MIKKMAQFKQFRVLGFPALVLIAACSKESTWPEHGVVDINSKGYAKVQVEQVSEQLISTDIYSYGTVESSGKINISVDLSGQIKSIGVEEGQRVNIGDEILTIDAEKQRLALVRATADLRKARATLDLKQDVYYRNESLIQQGAISQIDLSKSKSAYNEAEAVVNQLAAVVALAKQSLSDTRVESPVDGTVERVDFEVGQQIYSGSTIVVVQPDNSLRISSYLSFGDIGKLNLGTRAEVRSSGFPGIVYDARVSFIARKTNPNTGNFPVKLVISGHSDLIREGMGVSIVMRDLQPERVLAIPSSAVIFKTGKQVVYRVDDNQVHEVAPVLGDGNRTYQSVISGLNAGDIVVIAGQEMISAGTRVEIIQKENNTSSE